jgi:hypothetical protein
MTTKDKLIEKLKELRNKLYNKLPSGRINEFDLIRIIAIHLKDFDDLIASLESKLAKKQEPEGVTAEEILKKQTPIYLDDEIEACYIKTDVLKVMKAYHEAKLKKELIKYSEWYWEQNADSKKIKLMHTYGNYVSPLEYEVDEYLKQRNNG